MARFSARPGIRAQLMLFLCSICLLLLGLFWFLSTQMLEPLYNRRIEEQLSAQADEIVRLMDTATENGEILSSWDFGELMVSDTFREALYQALSKNSELTNFCVDISDTTLRNVLYIENLYPCLLHNSTLIDSDSSSPNAPTVLQMRRTCRENGQLLQSLRAPGGSSQMVVGRLTADGSYTVLVTTSLVHVGEAGQVLGRMLPTIAALIFAFAMAAAWLFSQWFTKPLRQLSAAARQVARGRDRELPMPGAEEAGAALERFTAAVVEALNSSDGDIAIVAHRSVNRLFLGSLAPDMPADALYQDYGSWSELEFDRTFRLGSLNLLPRPSLDRRACLALLKAAGLPEEVKGHCKAVAELALEIAGELEAAGVQSNRRLIESAALLHDIARLGPGHAELGARWLETLGYPAQAGIIRLHHESPEVPLEAAVVSIADKCISGTRRVGLEERFDLSLSKCGDEQARQAHARRRAAAEALRDRINSLCGKEVIP